MTKMERAFHAGTAGQLKLAGKKYGRLYFGPEFCERLLPAPAELKRAINFAESRGMEFTFVTPYLTDAGLKRALQLAKLLPHDSEIVVNDYGLLRMLQGSGHILVAGRILNRQHRDPKIAGFRGKAPKEMLSHLRASSASNKAFLELLSSMGVSRVEFDNVLQGIDAKLPKGTESSLCMPYCFVATTRFCLLANCDKIQFAKKIGIMPCSMECQRYSFELKSKNFPVKLIVSGNAVFFRNSRFPANLAHIGINRIVENALPQVE
jgi:hypothetical protein